MENYFYSAKNNGFYHVSLKADYEASQNGWPGDAVAISDELYNTLFEGQASGKVIGADNKGRPVLFAPPVPTSAQLIDAAKDQMSVLLAKAAEAITPLQYAVDVDDATDAELARLKAWKQFSVALNRLDLSTAPDIAWPEEPADVA